MADRDRRERILATAGALFVVRGVAGTTIRQIAAQMSMSSGTIYYYYPSKESIASAILHRFLDELLAEYEAPSLDVDPDRCDALFRRLIRTSLEVASRHPYAVEIYSNESSALAILPDHDEIAAKTARSRQHWRQILNAGRGNGTFRNDADAEHVRELINHLTWASVRWNRARLVADHRQIADELTAVLLDGYLVRAAGPGSASG